MTEKLTKIVNGERVELSAEEEAEIRAEWAAYDDGYAAAKLDPNNFPLQPYQFHAMLEIGGIAEAVDLAIEAMADPAQKAVAKARMKHSIKFDRDDALFALLGPAVGLTSEEIDALWMQAKDL